MCVVCIRSEGQSPSIESLKQIGRRKERISTPEFRLEVRVSIPVHIFTLSVKEKKTKVINKQFSHIPGWVGERRHSCEVKMDRNRNTGIISCSVCLEDFQTSINYLSEPVDVYSDWIDACESANQ
ncbi:Hypothetical predicted protein [Octopus vulgaris]|uniref:Transcription elongation factor 1 homolog n=1 Tax=Octopus vulgaris TaxID=6645 RepID=A0AA36FIA0_OCTVU|nr:Hypothetical predicted protein [Octopus vulgaris]